MLSPLQLERARVKGKFIAIALIEKNVKQKEKKFNSEISIFQKSFCNRIRHFMSQHYISIKTNILLKQTQYLSGFVSTVMK